jgi:hypothetical protein
MMTTTTSQRRQWRILGKTNTAAHASTVAFPRIKRRADDRDDDDNNVDNDGNDAFLARERQWRQRQINARQQHDEHKSEQLYMF